MIITRYKLHKITGINESVFSKMWKRHLAGEDCYSFFTPDGKIDTDDGGFALKYGEKLIPEEWEKLVNKDKPKPAVKKESVKKSKPKIEIKPKPKKKEILEPKLNNKKILDIPGKDEELSDLARRATIAKHKGEIYKTQKAEMELKKARAELAELATIGQACIGYCMALNQTLFDQPRSFIDELKAGIKSGKSTTALTDIARKPAMEAVAESIELIKKEIARYKRDIKSDNKVSK